MRSTLSAAAVLLSAVQYAGAQTFTACNPLDKTCPADPALGSTHTSDFTQGADSFWTLADGTTMKYTADGANFVIAKASDAPTISASKYIFFGKVSVTTKAAPGTGIVSSFILQSDDLDEIDWEWLGSTDGSVESNFFGKGNTTTYDRAIYHDVADVIGTWHTYTIDWQSSAIKWYIDNALVRTLNYGDALALGGKNYPQTPMQVKLGNWIGCANEAATTDPKYAGTCSWAGGPVDLTQGPFTMLVKSVTIEDASCGPEYTFSDNSGSYQSIKFAGTCGSSSSGSSSISGSSSSSSVSASASSSSATHSSSAASSSTTKSEAPTTTSKAVTSSKAATSSSAPTTTSAATSSTHAASNGTASSTGSAPATTSPGGPSANAASANQHKYGFLDVAVVAVGLGLGYLVM